MSDTSKTDFQDGECKVLSRVVERTGNRFLVDAIDRYARNEEGQRRGKADDGRP